jgi:hypothetical protein
LVIDTVVCLTLAKWETVSGQFGGYLIEKAEAFFKSKAWTDLGPDREKALKTIRRYAVEIVQ